MPFPEMPPALRAKMPPEFWNWYQTHKSYMLNQLSTNQDMTLATSGKGVVMTSSTGVTKRVRINDAGNGLIFEDT